MIEQKIFPSINCCFGPEVASGEECLYSPSKLPDIRGSFFLDKLNSESFDSLRINSSNCSGSGWRERGKNC